MDRRTGFFLALALTVLGPMARRACAWGLATHAYVARQAAGAAHDTELDPLLRLGAILPDFFWYLSEIGLLDWETARYYHGVTEAPEPTAATTVLYDLLRERYVPRYARLAAMADGARTHELADVRAHSVTDGYVEGIDMWVDLLLHRIKEADRDAAHLAVEFAMDALVVDAHGYQLTDVTPGLLPTMLPWRGEFSAYAKTARTLEQLAGRYGPYMLQAAANRTFLPPRVPPAFQGAEAVSYVRALRLLLLYPREIYGTLTSHGMHWQRDALPAAIAACEAAAL